MSQTMSELDGALQPARASTDVPHRFTTSGPFPHCYADGDDEEECMQELRAVDGAQAESLGPATVVRIHTAHSVYAVQFTTLVEAQDLLRQLISNPEPQVLNGENWVLNLGERVQFAYLDDRDGNHVTIAAAPTPNAGLSRPPGSPHLPRSSRPRELGS